MDELLHNDYSNDAAGLQINFFGYAQKLTKPNDLLVFFTIAKRKSTKFSFLLY